MSKPLSPSAAARWLACPGSHYVAQQLPPLPSSPAAEEGTLAHAFAAWVLYQSLALAYPDAELVSPAPPEPEEAIATEEMLSGAQTYADAVLAELAGHGGIDAYGIECEVTGYGGMVKGRADFIAWAKDRTAFVADYKFGGEPVPAKNNPQLTIYGYCAAFMRVSHAVRVGIIQPRAETADFLPAAASWANADFSGGGLTDAVARAYEADANTLRTPGEHCRWCPARSVCLAAVAEPLLLACTAAGQAEMQQDATDEQIGAWLTAIKRVDKVADDLSRIAKARISEGAEIPGWRISWRKKLDWDTDEKDPRAAACEIANRLGIDHEDLLKISLKSPAEMKKTLPADAIASVARETASSALIGSK